MFLIFAFLLLCIFPDNIFIYKYIALSVPRVYGRASLIVHLENMKFFKVDDVEHPSWQAQIKGEKLWILEPPRECHYTCKKLEVIVHPGEISELFEIKSNMNYV